LGPVVLERDKHTRVEKKLNKKGRHSRWKRGKPSRITNGSLGKKRLRRRPTGGEGKGLEVRSTI